MRMIFVNLPVKDLQASTAFFTGLGFAFEPQFSDERPRAWSSTRTSSSCCSWKNASESDATTSTEVLTCLSAESRAEVDEMITKALAAGGKPWKPIMEEGPMYGGSFQDFDGHVWEVLYMEQPAEAQ